jgi:RNA polymerase sigma-70 factor (ECF subfamily)
VEHAWIPTDDPIERDRLRAALAQLPLEQRIPLQMAYYEGKTHTEIADELRQPLGTVKGRIAGGLRKLAAALAPPEDRA